MYAPVPVMPNLHFGPLSLDTTHILKMPTALAPAASLGSLASAILNDVFVLFPRSALRGRIRSLIAQPETEAWTKGTPKNDPKDQHTFREWQASEDQDKNQEAEEAQHSQRQNEGGDEVVIISFSMLNRGSGRLHHGPIRQPFDTPG